MARLLDIIRDGLRAKGGKMPGAGRKSCLECAGTGTCRTCRGIGRLIEDRHPTKVKCFQCEGSKRCWLCVGRGNVTEEIHEARQEYEKRVKRMGDLTRRGHHPTELARILLDARSGLRKWEVGEVEKLLREFDRRDPLTKRRDPAA